ncbi:MAG TPA: DUF3027 domain-containing protein [Microbacterium sp.]|nr:DUF3027 domain-containing protein [Microbacterium sp.]
MTSKPDADERLIGAHDLALAALREITPASTIGPAAGYLLEEDGSVSLRFANRLPGYPGWHWTVTVARVDESDPTVLEVELLPGEGALLAPEWVPWVERLAEYRAHQAELAELAAAAESGSEGGVVPADLDEDEDLDDDELDELDDDEDHEADILHAGDLDGVDIDELDDSGEELDAEDDEGDEPDEPEGDEEE